MDRKRNLGLVAALVSAVFFMFCGCAERMYTLEQFLDHVEAEGFEVENIVYYMDGPGMMQLNKEFDGRVMDVDINGVTIIVVQKKDAKAAKEQAALTGKVPAPFGLEGVKFVAYARKNIVMLIRYEELRKEASVKVLNMLKLL